jgi:hypothetical protein
LTPGGGRGTAQPPPLRGATAQLCRRELPRFEFTSTAVRMRAAWDNDVETP